MNVRLDTWLLEILACPNCGGELRAEERDDELVCTGTCGYAYPVRDDIPVLLVDEARTPTP
ncbi:Trm112 family protein [Actinomadura sp. 21ATH]|uniref:Trm112 family protein n=1 Tax=Actinomadura sp. 21ATH TaxID=1735444 RepID=UPI0035C266C8